MLSLPMTKTNVVKKLTDVEFALSLNFVNSGRFIPESSIRIYEDRVVGAGLSQWKVENGRLYLLDERDKEVYIFDGLQMIGGIPVLTGEGLRVSGTGSFTQVVMSPFACVNDEAISISVSSHVDYFSRTGEFLTESMEAAGVDLDRVFFAIEGGTKEGIQARGVSKGKMGFTGLVDWEGESSYVLLLHDTMEVLPEFNAELKKIDFGLQPDMILLNGTSEIGFYRKEFIDEIQPLIREERSDLLLGMLKSKASVYVELEKVSKKVGQRDIYGLGVRRDVLDIGCGLRKFEGKKRANGSP